MDEHGLVPTVPATISQTAPAPRLLPETGSNGQAQHGLADMFGDDDDEPTTPAIEVNPPSPSNSASPPLAQNTPVNALSPSDSAAASPKASRRTPSPSGSARSRSDRARSAGSTRSGSGSARGGSRNPLEYDEEEQTGDGFQRELESEIVHLSETPGLTSSDGQVWSLRLPMYTSAPQYPFHPDLYRHTEQAKQDKEDAEDGVDDEKKRERAMVRMHEVRSAMRWKWGDDTRGGSIKKTNSRVIKWSDGTTSLQIGEELFDVNVSAVTGSARPFGSTSTGPETKAAPGRGTSLPAKNVKPNLDGPISVLYKADYDAEALRAENIVTGVIGLVPVTPKVKNFQKELQAMTGSGLKKAKITLNTDDSMQDPMTAAKARNKKFEAQESVRLDLKGKSGGNAWRNRSMKGERSGGFDDGDGSDDDIRVSRGGGGGGRSGGKRSGKGRKRNTDDFYSDDDDDEDLPPAKRSAGRFEVGGGNVGEYEEDDFVVADESDEEDDGEESDEAEDDEGLEAASADEEDLEAVSRKERKRDRKVKEKEKRQKRRDFTPDDEGEGEDGKSELELAEQEAERAEKERRRARKEEAKRQKSTQVVEDPDGSDDAMAIDEDEAAPTEPTRKKKVLEYDSEEE